MHLGPADGEHEEPQPLFPERGLDQVQTGAIAPVQILEDEHDGGDGARGMDELHPRAHHLIRGRFSICPSTRLDFLVRSVDAARASMDVIASSPLRAATLVFQPRAGSFALTVVCKATFLLTPGVATLAEEQDELLDGEEHWDNDPRRSLRAPSDLWPIKPRPEVLLIGSAWAPRREPVHQLRVRLVVGDVDKAVDVFGARLWTATGELREGPPWMNMPLRYERAAGGPDTWNPVGVRLDGSPDLYGQKHLPNLQPEGVELLERGQFLPPVGFGPISFTWPLRRERLGRRVFAREEPLGDDFDRSFFQDAPLDQQLGALRDDERIELKNAHPDHPRLVTHLPGLRPQAVMEVGRARQEVTLGADTLWIDTDRKICTLTYRGQVTLADPEAPRRVSIKVDRMRGSVASPGETTLEVTTTQPPGSLPPPLPFVLAGSALSSSVVSAPSAPFVGAAADASVTQAPVEPAVTPLHPGRQSTQEVVVPRGGLPGPTWLSDRGAPSPAAPPPPPAPPALPIEPTPPARVELLTRAAPGPAPTLNSASAAAMAGSPPALREQSARPPPPRLEAFAPVAGAPLGVAAASDAAAGRGPVRDRAQDPAPRKGPSVEESRAPLASTVELLWFDPPIVTRLRAHPDYAALTRPLAKQNVQAGKPPPSPPTPEAQEKAARGDVHRVLSKGPLSSAGGAKSDDGDDSDAPLLLLEGTLSFPFDELGELEATLQLARPLALTDKKLKDLLDAITEAQRAGADTREAAQGMSERIREAWENANRKLPGDHLNGQIEQRLLEKRQYQKRELLDDEWIRALFTPKSSETAVPTYLPARLAKRLPLFPRFAVRVLVELHPQQDQREKHGAALKVVAIARLSARPRIEG